MKEIQISDEVLPGDKLEGPFLRPAKFQHVWHGRSCNGRERDRDKADALRRRS